MLLPEDEYIYRGDISCNWHKRIDQISFQKVYNIMWMTTWIKKFIYLLFFIFIFSCYFSFILQQSGFFLIFYFTLLPKLFCFRFDSKLFFVYIYWCDYQLLPLLSQKLNPSKKRLEILLSTFVALIVYSLNYFSIFITLNICKFQNDFLNCWRIKNMLTAKLSI